MTGKGTGIEKKAVRAKFAHTADDEKKSSQGTRPRIWATQRLKEYLIQGYAINEKRLTTLKQANAHSLREPVTYLQNIEIPLSGDRPKQAEADNEICLSINSYIPPCDRYMVGNTCKKRGTIAPTLLHDCCLRKKSFRLTRYPCSKQPIARSSKNQMLLSSHWGASLRCLGWMA